MTRDAVIYGLFSTRDGEFRYIGQTTQEPKRRLCQHRNYAKSKRTAVHKWIAREVALGFEIRIAILMDTAVFNLTEIEFIAKYRDAGARLLNLTEGGEGTCGWHGNKGVKRPDLAVRNRTSRVWLGRTHGSAARLKLSQKLRGRSCPWNAERNRRQLIWIGRKHTEETKAKMRAAQIGKVVSAETRQKLSDAHKARGKKLSPEAVAKLRAGHRKYFEQKRPAI